MSDEKSDKYKNIRLKSTTYEELDNILYEKKLKSMDSTINHLINTSKDAFRHQILIKYLRYGLGLIQRSELVYELDKNKKFGYAYFLWDPKMRKAETIMVEKPGPNPDNLMVYPPTPGNEEAGNIKTFEGENYIAEFIDDIESKIEQGYIFSCPPYWPATVEWQRMDKFEQKTGKKFDPRAYYFPEGEDEEKKG